MNGSTTGTRSQRVVGATAAVVLVTLAVAVTVAGKAPVVAVDGGAPATGPALTLSGMRNTYYIPRADSPVRDDTPGKYQITLKAREPYPVVKNVKVRIDLSVLKGKARPIWPDQGNKCGMTGQIMTCTVDVEQGAIFTPFTLVPQPGAAPGPAGAITVTVTGPGIPTVRHATQVIIGAPVITARQVPKRTGVRPGTGMELTPAFGNRGDTGIDGGVTVLVEASGATLRRVHGNCRYDKAVAPTRAQCDFPGPLPPGAAYETDAPFTAQADATAMHGRVSYTVLRAHETSGEHRLLPASAPRGTGAPLGLRPVDGGGSDFAPSMYSHADAATSVLDFDTTGINDLQAVGFTIKGKVGETVDAQVPYPRNFVDPEMAVTLPEGISLVTVPRGEHTSDMVYCEPGASGSGPAECHGYEVGGTWVRVRIDRRVEGARGSVHALSGPKSDPNQENNTAPVTVEYTG
ncbi:hypothetical protein AB0B21_22215 [Streptomyces rimosus]|uniref:hypothetical protein n=1 Tax=Streptomyces rimosus TaxID=1927 RepID=UPI00131DB29D|nr:hypothetical protein [Streptomyces rimosus]